MVSEPSHLGATRRTYDSVARDYARHFRDETDGKPWTRATLTTFAELVRDANAGPVLDVGCGPGHVTAYLASLGLTVRGIDLSASMVREARASYPEIPFDTQTMAALDVENAALGGVVAWYSIIHTPPGELPGLLAEFRRVLAPGGFVLLAFQVGAQPLHLSEAFGQAVDATFHRYEPDHVARELAAAGLPVNARLVREPDATERVPQAHLLAVRHDRPG